MKIEQNRWTKEFGWQSPLGERLGSSASLVLVFAGSSAIADPSWYEQARGAYGAACFFGCSTSGEIQDTRVSDGSVSLTAVTFDHTSVKGAKVRIEDCRDSREAGERMAKGIPLEGLTHVLVLSDGLRVNGSDLVNGVRDQLPPHVGITGGLAGDGSDFKRTAVMMDALPEPGIVAAVGFYGSHLQVGYGSLGGWDPFGPDRMVTRSRGNVLYELDGRSALDLYKTYLGDHAKDLPGAGLLFPLCLRTQTGEAGVVRTILSVDEKDKSITFAGDIPEGGYAQFMKANFDRLIDGAVGAAKATRSSGKAQDCDLAILISCVGRKMVLKQRIEEEVEGVREVLGGRPALTGFYSYGEISPFTPSARCELHNQTMTLTTFREG